MWASSAAVAPDADESYRDIIARILGRATLDSASPPQFVPEVQQTPRHVQAAHVVTWPRVHMQGHDYVEGFVFPAGLPRPLPHSWTAVGDVHVDTTRCNRMDVYYQVRRVARCEFITSTDDDAFAEEFMLGEPLPYSRACRTAQAAA